MTKPSLTTSTPLGYTGPHNPFLEFTHTWSTLALRNWSLALTTQAQLASLGAELSTLWGFGVAGKLQKDYARYLEANAHLARNLVREYPKPDWSLDITTVDGVEHNVTVETVTELPFGDLLHFARTPVSAPQRKSKSTSESSLSQPKVLLVAPMSGHYATLLRPTVERLLPHAEVYITDWRSAREVPQGAGAFTLDTYADYVQAFIRTLGPDTHVIAICQSTVPVTMAVSRMAEDAPSEQPLTVTLMAGPLDPGAAPTEVTKLADKMNLPSYLSTFIARAPNGRKVYPGYVQLASFISMNPESHLNSHKDLYKYYVTDATNPGVERIERFYREYFAVADLPAEFYADTVSKVFIEKQLANGTLEYAGRVVDHSLVTARILGIEGANDDISAPGQTKDFLPRFSSATVKFYEQESAGHYGVFAGGLWRSEIAPRLLGEFHEAAREAGIEYAPLGFEAPRMEAL